MKIITVTANPALDITAHVDSWRRGQVNRGQSSSVAAGGKGINVAINLAHSGLEVYVTGWLGRDNDNAFRRCFMQHRINDDFIRIDGETRRNVKIIDTSKNRNTNFNMPGVEVSKKDKAALRDYLDARVDEWTVLVFSGSLPPGIKNNYYAQMVERYRKKSHFILVDADRKALSEVLQADWLPDMIKPNIHQFRAVTGKALASDEDIVSEAKAWVARGIKLVVVSMGHDGAWFVSADEAIKAKPLNVDVVNTVGAGDAMVAGLIHDVVIGKSLTDTAKTATAYSLGNIEQIEVGLPSKAHLEELKSQVAIEVLIKNACD